MAACPLTRLLSTYVCAATYCVNLLLVAVVSVGCVSSNFLRNLLNTYPDFALSMRLRCCVELVLFDVDKLCWPEIKN
jgi:hypothetical protein